MNERKCPPMVSIGILAHNEEACIQETLLSLFAQDVFQLYPFEIIVVANGCTDKTVPICTQMLANHSSIWSRRGEARVEELTAAGKANAWNEFVHRLSSSNASILILMDADIIMLNINTISSMVATLKRNPHAAICVDRPIKDIELKSKLSFFEQLLLAATPTVNPHNIPLCGQLYCARSESLRSITLPTEITCEDGFLRALLLTRGFTSPEDPTLIVMDTTATHGFKSVASLTELFRHEKWIVSGNIVNAILFERFWAEAVADRSAMTLMRIWKLQDPQWLPQYVQSEARRRGWHLLPREVWTRRWIRLKGHPMRSILFKLPAISIAAAIDAIIFIAAMADVWRGRAFRYWGRS